MMWEEKKQQEQKEANRKSINSVDSEDLSLSSSDAHSEKETRCVRYNKLHLMSGIVKR